LKRDKYFPIQIPSQIWNPEILKYQQGDFYPDHFWKVPYLMTRKSGLAEVPNISDHSQKALRSSTSQILLPKIYIPWVLGAQLTQSDALSFE